MRRLRPGRAGIQGNGGYDFSCSTLSVTPIATSADYYLKEDHTTSLRSELKKNLLLTLVCLSGAYLYWAPAQSYAERVRRENLSWLYVFSTCFPALAVLYVATDTFFNWHASSNTPEALSNVLTVPQTKAQRYRENALIGSVSSISAIPLASIVFDFPPAGAKLGGLIILSMVILVDNTILHFLPVKLVLNEDKYLLPFLPLIYLWRRARNAYNNRHLSDQEKRQAAYDAQKASDHQQLKQLMIARVSLAQARMNQQVFSWRWSGLTYDLTMPDSMKTLSTSDSPLETVLSFLPESSQAPTSFLPNKVNTFCFSAVRAIGAIWIWACISGYYAEPFNQFYQWTGSYLASGIIAAPPDYFMSVLLAFFGQSIASGLYLYVTSWSENDTKIPTAVKLYPKIFMGAMMLNAVMAGFSYAAAVELVYRNFTYEWAKPFVPHLVNIAISGIAFLGFSAVRDFFFLMAIKVATHFGSENERLLGKANEKIEQYKNSINYMKGAELERELGHMTSEKRQKILGVDDEKFQGINNHAENFKRHYRPNRPWYSCFRSEPVGDIETTFLLVDPMRGLNP